MIYIRPTSRMTVQRLFCKYTALVHISSCLGRSKIQPSKICHRIQPEYSSIDRDIFQIRLSIETRSKTARRLSNCRGKLLEAKLLLIVSINYGKGEGKGRHFSTAFGRKRSLRFVVLLIRENVFGVYLMTSTKWLIIRRVDVTWSQICLEVNIKFEWLRLKKAVFCLPLLLKMLIMDSIYHEEM